MAGENENRYLANEELKIKRKKPCKETEAGIAELAIESASLVSSFNSFSSITGFGIDKVAGNGEILKSQWNAAIFAVDTEEIKTLEKTRDGLEICGKAVNGAEDIVAGNEAATRKRIEQLRFEIREINRRKGNKDF